jgi:hypothetical protein
MGKIAHWIDGVAVGAVVYAASFLFFYIAFQTPFGAALLSAAPCALAVWGYRRMFAKVIARRERTKRAKSAVERLVFLTEDEARAQIIQYADLDGTLLLRHPKGLPLDANELMALWRRSDGDAMRIITTGLISDQAYALAESLSNPSVGLYDAQAIEKRFEKSQLPPGEPPPKKRLSLRIPAKRVKHCAFYGTAMLGLYIATGLWAYLAGSIILLALTLPALRRRLPPGH